MHYQHIFMKIGDIDVSSMAGFVPRGGPGAL